MNGECYEDWLHKFNVYDRAVDVVSCWECVLKYLYSDVFPDYYFERFPSLPRNEDDPATPDFSAYFSEEYGIIGEIKRTFPEDEVAFNSTLSQLTKYDEDLALRTANGSRQSPETTDIVLMVSGSSAPQIGTRINRKINEENLLNFNSNLVLMRYQYNDDAILSRYEFQ